MRTLICILAAAIAGVIWLCNRPMTPGVLWSILGLTALIVGAGLAAVVLETLP